MPRAYAIGDVHGHFDLLQDAHRLIAADRKRTGDMDAPVIHLGDLVDRGPESAEVVDFLAAGPAPGHAPWCCVKGNHDHMFRLFLADPPERDSRLKREYTWLHPRLGGTTTLASYGIADPETRPEAEIAAEARARVPANHLAYIDQMPFYLAAAGVLFVHAGIRPDVALAEQNPEDLMWIREEFHNFRDQHPHLIVHGHTPIEVATHYGNRVNLDTGAAYGGPLTTAVVENGEVWQLTPEGRHPLDPKATA